ncbi:hypothetical protein AAVH_33997 [Aphelenchoides avenae]|nr:hypothetical protein AAVH_33997 [Aphelenchus avenae]
MRTAIYRVLLATYIGLGAVAALPIQDTKGTLVQKADVDGSSWDKMIRQRLQRMFSSDPRSARRQIALEGVGIPQNRASDEQETTPASSRERRAQKYPLCYFTAIPCHHKHRVRRHRHQQGKLYSRK